VNDKPPIDGNVQQIRLYTEGVELEMVVPVTGGLEGDITNWPASIQDPIYEALQKEVGRLKLTGELPFDINSAEIIMSRCDKDENGWFIHVVAKATKLRKKESDHVVKHGRVLH
jgi:hypothetical protein